MVRGLQLTLSLMAPSIGVLPPLLMGSCIPFNTSACPSNQPCPLPPGHTEPFLSTVSKEGLRQGVLLGLLISSSWVGPSFHSQQVGSGLSTLKMASSGWPLAPLPPPTLMPWPQSRATQSSPTWPRPAMVACTGKASTSLFPQVSPSPLGWGNPGNLVCDVGIVT